MVSTAQKRFMTSQMKAIIEYGRALGYDMKSRADREMAVSAWINSGRAADYRSIHGHPDFNYCTGAPDQIGDADFSDACHIHDLQYAMRCNRNRADNWLRGDIYNSARAGGMGRIRAATLAGIYYAGVRLFAPILGPINRDRKQDILLKEEAKRK
jgi:hypothetical protein